MGGGKTMAEYGFLPKPKRTRWATYQRLHDQYDQLQNRWGTGMMSILLSLCAGFVSARPKGESFAAISMNEVAAELAGALAVSVDSIIAHMVACSRRVRFFPKVMAFVDGCAKTRAIVTVNPDPISNVVVPEYRLDCQVDLIVASWQQGTEDKSAVCECAIAQLGSPHL
jgi:hypothetical protein